MICPPPNCTGCADNYVDFLPGYDRGDWTQVRPCPAYPLGCWPTDEALEEAMLEAREGRRVSALSKRWKASQSIHKTCGGE